MHVRCPECGRGYDDAQRWTLCPHRPLDQAAGRVVLTDHKVNPCNDRLEVQALDEPGAGGAHCLYKISGFNTASNPSDPFVARHGKPAEYATILFQNGPILESGVNGITIEVMLAIVAHRLRCFQAGPYKHVENGNALAHVETAMANLKARTTERTDRGVEGTHVV